MISSPTNVSSLLFYCTSLLKGSTLSDKPNSIFDISTLSGKHPFLDFVSLAIFIAGYFLSFVKGHVPGYLKSAVVQV